MNLFIVPFILLPESRPTWQGAAAAHSGDRLPPFVGLAHFAAVITP